MQTTQVALTDQIFWAATLLTALVDAAIVFLIARRLTAARLARMKWPLAVAAFVIFGALWTSLASGRYWEECYKYLFPAWSRWGLPLYVGLLFGAEGFLFAWLAPKIPGNAVVNFFVLGGLSSLPGHLWGIYGRGMFEKCAILRESTPLPALVFGVFEFIFYWIVIMGLAVLVQRALTRRQDSTNLES